MKNKNVNKSHIAVICNMAMYMDFHPADFDRICSLSEINISTVGRAFSAAQNLYTGMNI
jgi:hypothetical protein